MAAATFLAYIDQAYRTLVGNPATSDPATYLNGTAIARLAVAIADRTITATLD